MPVDYSFSEKQEMMRAAARELFYRECPPGLVRKVEAGEVRFPISLWKKLADLGWLGLMIPEEYGGSGATLLDLLVILEEAGRVLLPVPLIPNTAGALAVVLGGSRELKGKILPQLVCGEVIITVALTGPRVAAEADVVALWDTNSCCCRVRGTKVFVPDAMAARYIVFTAQSCAGSDGVSLLVVDLNATGVTCSPLKAISGAKLYQVTFDDVYVPAGNALGGVDGGVPLAEKITRFGAVAECAWMLGAARRIFEMAVEYVKVRKQYGRPIAAFQSVQHQCADMAVDLRAAEYLTHQAGWKLDKYPESVMEVSVAKAWVNEACRRVAAKACYLHGAVGYSEEHDVQLYLRRIIGAVSSFGDTSSHLRVVAQELLG